jgi:signal transduction histidine kinase
VTTLVVDLGAASEAGTLRARLASALGDPSLVIGYRLASAPSFVDDTGRPVELPRTGSGRTATRLVDHGEEVAILVHDEALLADSQLVESVAAAARIAVANAALQADAREQADELERSRRRIIEAADTQRRRLEQELRRGAGRRLDTVALLLANARWTADADDASEIAVLERQLDEARGELEEFARGIHPAVLTEQGLMAAVRQLAERSPIPVEVTGGVQRLTAPVEAALFFVCSEGVANVIKHARASRVTVDLAARGGRVHAVIADDGVGGASMPGGGGVRGVADRIEALGGQLRISSPVGDGTRVAVEIPIDGERRMA